jgi:hypothetical protein
MSFLFMGIPALLDAAMQDALDAGASTKEVTAAVETSR